MYTETTQYDYSAAPEGFLTAYEESVRSNERVAKEIKKLNEGWRVSDGHTSVAIVPRSYDGKKTWRLWIRVSTFDGFMVTYKGIREYRYGEVEPRAYQLSRKVANSPSGLIELLTLLTKKTVMTEAEFNDDI